MHGVVPHLGREEQVPPLLLDAAGGGGLAEEIARADDGELALMHQKALFEGIFEDADALEVVEFLGERDAGKAVVEELFFGLFGALRSAAPQHDAVARPLPDSKVGEKVFKGIQVPADGRGGEVVDGERAEETDVGKEGGERELGKKGDLVFHVFGRHILPKGEVHRLAPFEELRAALHVLLPQAVQFIGDEFALVEDDERFAVQYGEEGHGGR